MDQGRVYMIYSDNLDDYSSSIFYCSTKYTKRNSNQCSNCPNYCFSCEYDSSNNLICFSCNEGFTLNSQGICVACGDNCNNCYLDENNNSFCLACKNGYLLNEDKNCLTCGSNCISCKRADNTVECTKCLGGFGLNQYKQCVSCPTSCENCFLKEGENEFSCSSCSDLYHVLNEDDKCISCTSIEEIGVLGCSQCYYDNSSPDNYIYKCKVCNSGYVFIENEYKCISNSLESLSGCVNAIYNSESQFTNVLNVIVVIFMY